MLSKFFRQLMLALMACVCVTPALAQNTTTLTSELDRRGVKPMTSANIDAAGGDPTARRQVADALRLSALRSLKLATALPAVATVAPTVSVTGGASSTVNGQSYTTPTVPWSDSRLSYIGRVATLPANSAFGTGIDTNYGTAANRPVIGGRSVNSDFIRVRWMTDAPTFDMVLRTVAGTQTWNLYVDGRPVFASGQIGLATGAANFIKVDWGANAASYGFGLVGITNGGTGHAINDDITMDTGAVLRITAVGANGTATGAVIKTPGAYSSVVTTSAQTSSTGAGTGLIATPTQEVISNSTRKMRTYELRIKGSGSYGFGGLNLPINPISDTVAPWPAKGPRLLTMGDSITSDIFSDGPGYAYHSIAADLLGIEDAISSGAPSTGWVVSAGALTLGQRIPTDLTPLAPTDPSQPFVVVLAAGINDNAEPPAVVQAAVTAAVGAAIAANPRMNLIVLGPWQGYSDSGTMEAIEAAVQAGCQAAPGWNPRRHTFVPVLKKWLRPDGGKIGTASSSSGNSKFYMSQDGTHWGRATNEYVGRLLANEIKRIIEQDWSLSLSVAAPANDNARVLRAA